MNTRPQLLFRFARTFKTAPRFTLPFTQTRTFRTTSQLYKEDDASVVEYKESLASLLVENQPNFDILYVPQDSLLETKLQIFKAKGFTLNETREDGRVSITGVKNNFKFELVWDPNSNFTTPAPNEEEDIEEDEADNDEEADVDENEDANEETEQEEDENDQEEDDENNFPDPGKELLGLTLTKPDGKTIYFQCGIESEYLVIYGIGQSESGDLVSLQDVNEEVTEKFYQFIDGFIETDNPDANVVPFVKEYNATFWAKKQRDTYSYITDFFAKN